MARQAQDISHSPKIRRGEAGWGGPLVVGLVLGAYCLALRRYGLDLADEGTLLAQIDRVAHGQVPYRDFHTGYGPGLFYANAGLFTAFGTSIGTVRGGLALVHGVRAALLVWLAARVGPAGWWAVASLALVGFFLPVAPGSCAPFFVPYAAWYADALGLGALWVLARFAARRSRLVAGMLWGGAFVFKQNTGLLGLGAGAVALVLVSEGGERARAGRVVGTVLGVGLVAGGIALLRAHLDLALVALMLGPVAVLAVAVIRARPGRGAIGDVAMLAAGFALVALPVVGTMVRRAGPSAVATDLLQIGTDTALVYYVPYPSLGMVRDAFEGAAGLLRAVRQLGDLAWFAVFPLVNLTAAVLLLRRRVTTRVGIVVATAAIVGYLQLYPRMDGWHLLSLAPVSLATLGLVLAASGRPAQRTVAGALLVLSVGRALPVLAVLGALAEGTGAVVPVERVDVRWDLLAPDYLRRLPEVILAVQGRASVMGFPALGLVNFAIGTPSPVRHDYFFPGRPPANEEIVLVERLRTDPPGTVVTLDVPVAFFAAAFRAHPQLVAVLGERFVAQREIGPYRILVPRGGS